MSRTYSDKLAKKLEQLFKEESVESYEAAEAFVDAFTTYYAVDEGTVEYKSALQILDDFADEYLDEEEE